MEFPWISFIVLMFVLVAGIAFIFRLIMFNSAEGAVKRLSDEIAKANAKQSELSKKIKEADEDLAKKQAEARDLANKMRQDAEEQSKQEREKIIAQARKEGEDIIAKAQQAKEKMREEIERNNEMRVISHSTTILGTILSQKAQGAFQSLLISEFIETLKTIDMSKISPSMVEAEIVSLTPITDDAKQQFQQIFKTKLQRDIAVKTSVDPAIAGGVIIRFGSMALDGSLRNLMRETGIAMQEKVDRGEKVGV